MTPLLSIRFFENLPLGNRKSAPRHLHSDSLDSPSSLALVGPLTFAHLFLAAQSLTSTASFTLRHRSDERPKTKDQNGHWLPRFIPSPLSNGTFFGDRTASEGAGAWVVVVEKFFGSEVTCGVVRYGATERYALQSPPSELLGISTEVLRVVVGLISLLLERGSRRRCGTPQVECPKPQEKLLRNRTAHWHNGVYLLGSSLLGNCCLQGDYGVGLHCGHRSVFLGLIFRDETLMTMPAFRKKSILVASCASGIVMKVVSISVPCSLTGNVAIFTFFREVIQLCAGEACSRSAVNIHGIFGFQLLVDWFNIYQTELHIRGSGYGLIITLLGSFSELPLGGRIRACKSGRSVCILFHLEDHLVDPMRGRSRSELIVNCFPRQPEEGDVSNRFMTSGTYLQTWRHAFDEMVYVSLKYLVPSVSNSSSLGTTSSYYYLTQPYATHVQLVIDLGNEKATTALLHHDLDAILVGDTSLHVGVADLKILGFELLFCSDRNHADGAPVFRTWKPMKIEIVH
ncbi:hypothetical protein GEV33_012513 [Tenebrio molitor]|uniref:Uncharacterized protein n=1 Tax=Tenebrio molitor TaxID=7067 RepID=A0A8J6L3F5_TENMO|nr:hypothetical protein GEV33_012513 [Tenebrio molitor]